MACTNSIIIFLLLILPTMSAFVCHRLPHNAEPVSNHGQRTAEGRTHDIKCKAGFEATQRGRLTIRCLGNNKWTHVPCRFLRCPPLGLHHGHLVVTFSNYTRKVEASCNKGYVISGPTTRLCLAGGQWSGQNTKCEPLQKPVLCKDMPPDPGPPGTYNGVFNITTPHGAHHDGYRHGTKVVVSCKERYQFTGSRLWVCGMSGKWVGTKGECKLEEDITCELPALEEGSLHGTFNLSGTDTGVARYGQVMKVLCNPGYILEGAGTSTCQANGTWTLYGLCLPVTTTTTTTTTNDDSTESAMTTHHRPQEQTGVQDPQGDHEHRRRVRRGHRSGRQYKLRHPVHHGDPNY